MRKSRFFLIYLCLFGSSLITSIHTVNAQQMGNPDCNSVLLASSWANNQVKIYDGCSGTFIRNLDESGNIKGPQRLMELHSGNLLLVSEGNNRLIEYDRKSLSVAKVRVSHDEKGFISTPIAAEYEDASNILVASYGLNRVVRVNTDTWQMTNVVMTSGGDIVKGLDNGMALRNGHLYLPGWDSDNIAQLNVVTGTLTDFIPRALGGLDAPRGILFDGNRLIVSSERSHAILVYNADNGEFVEKLISTPLPAGLVFDGEEHILYTSADAVFRARLDGSEVEKVIAKGAGELKGATYVLRLTKKTNPAH